MELQFASLVLWLPTLGSGPLKGNKTNQKLNMINIVEKEEKAKCYDTQCWGFSFIFAYLINIGGLPYPGPQILK